MKKLIASLAAVLIALATGAAGSSSSPVFQIRLVLDEPSSESEEMSVINRFKDAMNNDQNLTNVIHVQKAVLLDQTALKSATVQKAKIGQPTIGVTFSEDGRKRFAEITRQNIGKRLAIVIAGRAYCAPKIMTEISGGKAQITGNFSEQEAKDLAVRINEAVTKN
jgi:preprotein translocase subunit SecD